MIRLFVCTDHDMHWPVGAASVVLAQDEEQARVLLDSELVSRGLKPYAKKPYQLREIPLDQLMAEVLVDGNY